MDWTSISDLPDNWSSISSTEVESLAEAWFQVYQTMQNTDVVEFFNEKLRREWSIETGILERLYTIDQGTTKLLVEQGIDAALIPSGATDRPVPEVIQIITSQREALDGIYDAVNQNRPLTSFYIRSLHQILLRHEDFAEAYDQFGSFGLTPLLKGEWRKMKSYTRRDNGSTYNYCPPEHIQSEIDRLLELHIIHLEQRVNPQVEAAWLHHRFTQIHPFQDGNGRVARCLATLVLLQAKRFPLVITREHRPEYLAALKEADEGDLGRLVRLFEYIEKMSYIQALELSEDVTTGKDYSDTIIESIISRYEDRRKSSFNRVFDVATDLWDTSKQFFNDYSEKMRNSFQSKGFPIQIRSGWNNQNNAIWYSEDIVSTARKLRYFANLTRPRLWARIKIRDEEGGAPSAEIVVSFHFLGKENRGVMMSSAFLNIIPQTSHPEEDERSFENRSFRENHAIVSEAFSFAHNDLGRLEQRRSEFKKWLEQAVYIGLTEWQRRI